MGSEAAYAPFKFVPAFGTQSTPADFKGTTLVMPTVSAGGSPFLAVDLFVCNDAVTKAGYLKSEYLAPLVQNDTLRLEGDAPGQIQMPVVLYTTADKRYTFLVCRTSVVSGQMRQFAGALGQFIAEAGFKGVTILTSTVSPVGRGRESNRQIPELLGYVNNFQYKQSLSGGQSYYDAHQIQKFGHWLGDMKKKPFQEMQELLGSGAAGKLMKALNRMEIPAQLFVIFTPGGHDFVGGFTFYQFLKNSFD